MNTTQIGQAVTQKRTVTVNLDQDVVEMYLEIKAAATAKGQQYSLTKAVSDMIRKAHTEQVGLFQEADADTCFF